MTDKEINKKIQDMIKLPKTSNKRILAFVKKKECQAASLTPSTLGMFFEIYAGIRYDTEDATTCFSRAITVEELEKVHPNFRSTNPVGAFGRKLSWKKIQNQKRAQKWQSVLC